MVSVIIPSYNSARTILRAIDSVINQSYRNLEIIIVDDGSTDNTKEIINEYIKSSIIKYYFQENQGPSIARNNGVGFASGEYIAFLDADDEWHIKKLEIQMKILKEKNLNFLGSSYTYDKFLDIGFNDESKYDIEKYSFKNIVFKNRFSTPCVIMKKSFFIELNGFDENLIFAEDYDMWLRASLKNDLYTITSPSLVKLYKFAYGVSGLSSNLYKMYCGEKIVYEKLLQQKNISFLKYFNIMVFLKIKLLRRYIIKILRRA